MPSGNDSAQYNDRHVLLATTIVTAARAPNKNVQAQLPYATQLVRARMLHRKH